MLTYKIILVLSLILILTPNSSSLFHHGQRSFTKTFHKTTNLFGHHHYQPHSWSSSSHWSNKGGSHKHWIHNLLNHHDGDDEEPKIDIRWDLDADNPKATQGLNGCKYKKEDFDVERHQICRTGDPLIIRKVNQGWCFGFYSPATAKRVLTLSLDRAYRIQYSPGSLQVDRTGSFGLRFTFRSNTIYTIILSGNGQGVPSVTDLKLDGKIICDDETKETSETPTTTESSHPHQHQQNRWKEQSCGKRRVVHSQLISNGVAARTGDWPWHAAVYHATGISFKYKCGGTLISHSSVLTAAHCVLENGNQIIPERVKVQLGKHHLYVSDPHSRDVLVFNIIVHPDFDYESSKHDIAFLKLAVKVTFSSHILPACLPPTDFNITNQVGTAIGWGRNEAGELPTVLHQASMLVPSPLECLESHRDFFGYFLNEANFCAGYRNGTTACAGDSGGGLYFQRDGKWTLRGIVSIAVRESVESGCQTDHFILLTDVAKHLDWIYRNK